jgi:DNA protecting protein DprA
MITEASPILNLLLAKGVGVKTLSEIVDSLLAGGLSPEEQAIDELASALDWRPDLTKSALAVQQQAAELAEQLDCQGVRILVRGFGIYPQRLVQVLGKNAPPVLFAKGNLSIFNSKAVGFCGSRHASEKGVHVAAESASALGARGVNVVSGYAAGVDLAAHCAALEAGGVTTIVLAEGILHFRAKREIKNLLTDDNHVVVSEYSPRLPWNARNAMQRNQTIIGLSDALIVIESGTTGGTRACGESAMKLGHPLFVAEYATPSGSAEGNKDFLNRGAVALRGDRQGRPNMTKVFEALGLNGEVKVAPAAENEPKSKTESPQPSSIRTATAPTHATEEMVQRTYPKRLIEVDLPIARISAHARREKSIRHGHISTLHIWWARRPLAACRAVICAALWPDPADPLCPQKFRDDAARLITQFAEKVIGGKVAGPSLLGTCSPESLARWEGMIKSGVPLDPAESDHQNVLRFALLDFIADFANWDNSTHPAYLETARTLTQSAHESLGGDPGTRPLVVDPFAGGGSIPLEALRVGADAFASDLNPIPVLLNKVVLEYIPKYGPGDPGYGGHRRQVRRVA